MELIETSERLLGLGEVARCDVGVTDEFVGVFRDYLELDGHVSEPSAIGVFLKGELVNSSKLDGM